jgi:HEAT repeat protein
MVTGVVSFGLTAALALQVTWMRSAKVVRAKRRRRFTERWRPLLYGAALGDVAAVPPLARDDEKSLLVLWTQLQDGLRGASSRAGLNRLAHAVDARSAALRLLHRGAPRDRLLALRTLGYLGETQDFATVRPYLDHRAAPMCLAAARALVHTDAPRATVEIWRGLRARHDWPVAQVAAVLGEGDLRRLGEAFAAEAPALPPPELVRLLPLLSILDDPTAARIVAALLAPDADPEVLAAALKQARAPELAPRVLELCRHPEWPVRTQAAAALGRFGPPEDRDALLALLRDRQWWVRYRAAQALLSGRFGPPQEVEALAAGLDDAYAHDILRHVRAEAQP